VTGYWDQPVLSMCVLFFLSLDASITSYVVVD
jgi:hypothetical protein